MLQTIPYTGPLTPQPTTTVSWCASGSLQEQRALAVLKQLVRLLDEHQEVVLTSNPASDEVTVDMQEVSIPAALNFSEVVNALHRALATVRGADF